MPDEPFVLTFPVRAILLVAKQLEDGSVPLSEIFSIGVGDKAGVALFTDKEGAESFAEDVVQRDYKLLTLTDGPALLSFLRGYPADGPELAAFDPYREGYKVRAFPIKEVIAWIESSPTSD